MTDELEWANEAREATLEALVSIDLLLHNAGSDQRERVRKHSEQAARDLARASEVLARPPYDLSTAEPDPRLWDTIRREGLDANPWDPSIVDEIGTVSGDLSLRSRVSDSLGIDPESVLLVSRSLSETADTPDGWTSQPISEVFDK